MRFLAGSISLALAIALAVAGCGSSSKSSSKSPTTGGSSTAPPIVSQNPTGPSGPTGSSGSSKNGKEKLPPVPRGGEVIRAGSFFAFKAPSAKMGCAYTKNPTTLRCDVTFPTRFTKSGHKCTEGVYGHSFQMSGSGGRSGAICAGDTVLSAVGAKTIPYGHAWTIGPYACTSMTSSLTCTNAQGHGWRLSASQQLLF
jgi:hypothetical protein